MLCEENNIYNRFDVNVNLFSAFVLTIYNINQDSITKQNVSGATNAWKGPGRLRICIKWRTLKT